jgi:hypothetical protein
MKPKSLLPQTLRIFGFVVLIVLLTVAIIAGIGWWAGWQTEQKFKTAIQIAGWLLIAFGFLGIKGNLETAVNSGDRQNALAPKEDNWIRFQHSLLGFFRNHSFLLIMFGAGGVCLVTGWLM